MARLTDEEKAARAAARAEAARERNGLAAEESARRRARSRERAMLLHDQREAAGVLPTRESAAAGVPCVSCGLPYRAIPSDPVPPEGIEGYPERERIRQEQLAAFKVRHADCIDPMPSGYQGSIYLHCNECCPTIPFPAETYSRLRVIMRLDQSPEEREAYVTRNCNLWRATLRCGHTADSSVHKDHKHHSGESAPWCKECNDYRAVVSTEMVGALSDLVNKREPKIKPKPTKRAVAAQRRKLRELEGAAVEARRQLAELEAEASE